MHSWFLPLFDGLHTPSLHADSSTRATISAMRGRLEIFDIAICSAGVVVTLLAATLSLAVAVLCAGIAAAKTAVSESEDCKCDYG